MRSVAPGIIRKTIKYVKSRDTLVNRQRERETETKKHLLFILNGNVNLYSNVCTRVCVKRIEWSTSEYEKTIFVLTTFKSEAII